MKTIYLLPLLFLFLFSQNLHADSPLTSTAISKAYKNSKIIKRASKSEGKLNIKLLRYLTKKRKPIALKIALINELGWNFNGRNNAEIFFEYLKKKNNYKNIDDFLNQESADNIICMAYLKALDNYFNVDEAIKYARVATSKNKESYTVNIICSLIEAQKAMNSSFCEVYNLTNNIRIDESLNDDMNNEAIEIIFDYTDLYKEDCK